MIKNIPTNDVMWFNLNAFIHRTYIDIPPISYDLFIKLMNSIEPVLGSGFVISYTSSHEPFNDLLFTQEIKK